MKARSIIYLIVGPLLVVSVQSASNDSLYKSVPPSGKVIESRFSLTDFIPSSWTIAEYGPFGISNKSSDHLKDIVGKRELLGISAAWLYDSIYLDPVYEIIKVNAWEDLWEISRIKPYQLGIKTDSIEVLKITYKGNPEEADILEDQAYIGYYIINDATLRSADFVYTRDVSHVLEYSGSNDFTGTIPRYPDSRYIHIFLYSNCDTWEITLRNNSGSLVYESTAQHESADRNIIDLTREDDRSLFFLLSVRDLSGKNGCEWRIGIVFKQ